MRRTDELTLLSGIKCKIQELTGEHEGNLTSSKENIRKNAMDRLLEDCILELGDVVGPNMNHIKRMLEADRKHALIAIRQLSNDYDPNFNFFFEFPSKNGQKDKQKFNVDFTYAIMQTENFDKVKNEVTITQTPILFEGEVPKNKKPVNFEAKPYWKKFKTLDEIRDEQDQIFVLPRSGRKVIWSLLTGELKASFIENSKFQNDNNSHDLFKMRNCRYVETDEKGQKSYIQIDFKTMIYKDIEALRAEILSKEGSFDTLLVIQNQKDSTQKERVDLLDQPAFFFPSLAI